LTKRCVQRKSPGEGHGRVLINDRGRSQRTGVKGGEKPKVRGFEARRKRKENGEGGSITARPRRIPISSKTPPKTGRIHPPPPGNRVAR